jgi:K+-sensing histidine kinase KdpD
VAIVIVGRVQFGLARAQAREREAIFMYEMSSALASARTVESVARILAGKIQQVYLAAQVQVFVEREGQSLQASVPEEAAPEHAALERKPDLVLPIMTVDGLEGEVRMWQGHYPLPAPEDRLLLNFINQTALAIHRAQFLDSSKIPL